ncbi:uracil-DNA glycosylase family protein [Methylomonas fluvii]|uniref:uracil-DNA glycosylase family protein n=1 Tax=Methylomonas fluvii TaxID=1854564 RepID=UPI001CAA87AC|nr:uracil-DNA glycosylase family protein [Methylomonas fluvii]
MPTNTCLFNQYQNAISSLDPNSLENGYFPEDLLIQKQGSFSVWYSPFDYVNPAAKIVLVGITPGYQQASNALRKAHQVLMAGGSIEHAKSESKKFASFSGPIRNNLTGMLDFIGIPQLLNIPSTKAFFEDQTHLVHFTSALRYPVMINGENYGGTPAITKTPFLKHQLESWFAKECQMLPDALFVPLGPKVSESLWALKEKGMLRGDQILDGLPHPSGANAERVKYFLMKKSRDALSSRTNASVIDQARESLTRKVNNAIARK